MNKEQIEGNWKQLKGEIKRKWGLLTDDEITASEGRAEILVGKLQEHYGLLKEDAHRQWEEFLKHAAQHPVNAPEERIG